MGTRGSQDNKAYQCIKKPKGIIWQNLREVPCTASKGVRHTGKL